MIERYTTILFFLLFIFSLVSCQTVAEESRSNVAVRIMETKDTITIKLNQKWDLESESNKGLKFLENQLIKIFHRKNSLKVLIENEIHSFNEIIKLKNDNDGSIDVLDVPFGIGWWWEGKEDRNYDGDVLIHLNNENMVEVIIELPIEEYLKGVIPYEIGGDSPVEALKAQAVAARSEAFVALKSGLYGGKFHDLTADVECQVFSGNKKRTEKSDKAVEETSGLVLMENQSVINAYYASNCGGHSEKIKYVWPERDEKESYKTAKNDWKTVNSIDLTTENNIEQWINSSPESFCNPQSVNHLPLWSKKYFRWELPLKKDNKTNLSVDTKYGNLIDIIPQRRGESGRIYEAEFQFENKTIKVTGELKIRQIFSPAIKSSCFIVEKDKNGLLIKGAGWGHGVGMCQSGAVAQALNGTSFKEILNHYYSAADIKNIYRK